MGTGGPPYTNVLRPRITIKTVDGADTLYTFDAFEGTNDLNVGYCDMESAVSETGTFNIRIQDHNNLIPKDNIHSVKVFLELGKTQASLQHFLIGYGDIFAVDRERTNSQIYNLTGFGSSLWAYQLFIHRREKYRRTESDAKIYNIIDNALTKRLWRPLKTGDDSIEDITGWEPSGISTKVNTPVTVIDKPFTYFGDLCDELCDISGAVWFIDCSTGVEIFTLSYNPELQTKTIIKSGDNADRVNDDGSTTAYIKGPFRVEDNSTTESGTATRLISATIQDQQKVFELPDVGGFTTLDFRALAQQIIIDNDARRIEELELSLEKKGEPDSPKGRVNGDIVLDKANKPTGEVLDEFHIDLGSIKQNPEKIRIAVDIKAKDLDVAQSKIWVRLFQRSGNADTVFPSGSHLGDPVHDPDNTIRWHHNNKFNATQLYYSAQAAEGDEDKKDKLNWQATNQGPLYRVALYSNIRRLFSRTNSGAANRIRLREQFVDTSFLDNPTDVSQYLSLSLSRSSKGRRAIQDLNVTIPNDFLFRAYQWVYFSDGLSGITDTLRVQRAKYTIASIGGEEPQIGTLTANLTLSGLYNTLVGSCTCE
jgi:hypothetical protein